jgi:hypothetical protein
MLRRAPIVDRDDDRLALGRIAPAVGIARGHVTGEVATTVEVEHESAARPARPVDVHADRGAVGCLNLVPDDGHVVAHRQSRVHRDRVRLEARTTLLPRADRQSGAGGWQ